MSKKDKTAKEEQVSLASKKGRKQDNKLKVQKKLAEKLRKKAAKKESKAARASASAAGERASSSRAQDVAAKAAQAAQGIAGAAVSATSAIVKQGGKLLSKTDRHHTVGGLEAYLFKMFPAKTAEPWDRTGLLVGDRACPVTKVAVTLDPTPRAIEEAAKAGANVLLTHHPAFLTAPDSFEPAPSVALNPGAGVVAALKQGVALMDFHTALDVSRQAQTVLPGMLDLHYEGKVLAPIEESVSLGYGQICTVSAKELETQPLAHIAARCTAVFGRAPRVWGPLDANVRSVVTATGSASNVGMRALEAGIDCLICGELHYHDALDLAQAGLCIIELGHDVSEFPLTAVLADAVASYGIASDRVIIVDQTNNWTYPETIRL